MAGDPWVDCTTTTGIWDNTTSTTEVTGLTRCGTYTVSYTARHNNDEDIQELILELIERQLIKDMKATWKQDKKEFKPLPIRRPQHQLQNICFNGRGWA